MALPIRISYQAIQPVFIVKLKPSLTWLLLFVPIAIVLRFWPDAENPTALFICSAIGIIPLAGLMGRATEALAARIGEGSRRIIECHVWERGGTHHCRSCALERSNQRGQSVDHGLDNRRHSARLRAINLARGHKVQRAAV